MLYQSEEASAAHNLIWMDLKENEQIQLAIGMKLEQKER